MLFSLLLFCHSVCYRNSKPREFIDVLKYMCFGKPPSYLLIMFISAASCWLFWVWKPLHDFPKLMAYILLAGFVIVLILAIPLYDSHRLFPILGHGLWGTITHGLRRCSAYGEIIIIGIMSILSRVQSMSNKPHIPALLCQG